jgi:membrane protein
MSDSTLTPAERLGSVVFFLQRLAARVHSVGISRVAASLAFTTLLGLVPLFTVAFTYVARVPLFQSWLDQLEPFLLRFLLPAGSNTIRGYLSEFTGKAAELTGVSTVVVVITAMLLVAEIEQEINAIWGITKARSLVRRALIYAVGFVAVPVLIGGAVYITSLVIQQSMEVSPTATEALSFIAKPLTLVVFSLILSILYWLVPSRPVPFRSALVAGILAAIALAVAKTGFTFYIHHFSTYQMVYGALAAVPLFLIWVYVSWIILLSGAVIAATITEVADDRRSAPR